MAKNKNTMKKDAQAPAPSSAAFDSRGKLLIGTGGALVLAGFVLLSFADSMALNLPARLSPFLLIAGYAAIGFGLYLPAVPPTPPTP